MNGSKRTRKKDKNLLSNLYLGCLGGFDRGLRYGDYHTGQGRRQVGATGGQGHTHGPHLTKHNIKVLVVRVPSLGGIEGA